MNLIGHSELQCAVLSLSILIGAASCATPPEPKPVLPNVDHIVYATPDVELGVETLEHVLGVRAISGGQHPGMGTRNALLSLGPSTYLEIIGPDPQQPDPEGPRFFGIDQLSRGRLVTWVAKGADLDARVAAAHEHGVELGEVTPGSRRKPDGSELSWRATNAHASLGDGLAPFFIEWSEDSAHPAITAPAGCTLIGLRAEHPDPESLRAVLRALDLDLQVEVGPTPALIATIQSPNGIVELR